MSHSKKKFAKFDTKHQELTESSYEFLDYIHRKKDTSISLFNTLNENEKIVVWKHLRRQKEQQFHHPSVDKLFSPQLGNLEKDAYFFQHYLLPLKNNSYQHLELFWFLKNASTDWLSVEKDSAKNNIFQHIFPSIINNFETSSYQNIVKHFADQLNSLKHFQFTDFVHYYIKPQSSHSQMIFLNICYRFCDKEKLSILSHIYKDNMTEQDKEALGWSLIQYRIDDVLHDYKDWIVLGINKNIADTHCALDCGRNVSIEKITLLYEIYSHLEQNDAISFYEKMLSQVFLRKENQYLIPHILKIREDNMSNDICNISPETLVFFIWRAVHVMKHEDRLNILSHIVEHTQKTNEYQWLKSVLYTDQTLTFNHTKMNMNHKAMHDLVHYFMHLGLQTELVEKSSVIRNKL